MPRSIPWFGLAAAIVAADQAAKVAILAWLAPGRGLRVTGFFDLVLTFNKGAAFSLLAGAPGWQTPLFIGVALVAVFVLTALLVRSTGNAVYRAGLALILGGAVGNALDRLLRGHVVDFIHFHWFERWYFPAFNAADTAITVGAGLLLLDSLLESRRTRTAADPP